MAHEPGIGGWVRIRNKEFSFGVENAVAGSAAGS